MLYADKYPSPVSGQELPDGIVWAHNRFRYSLKLRNRAPPFLPSIRFISYLDGRNPNI